MHAISCLFCSGFLLHGWVLLSVAVVDICIHIQLLMSGFSIVKTHFFAMPPSIIFAFCMFILNDTVGISRLISSIIFGSLSSSFLKSTMLSAKHKLLKYLPLILTPVLSQSFVEVFQMCSLRGGVWFAVSPNFCVFWNAALPEQWVNVPDTHGNKQQFQVPSLMPTLY